MDTLSQDSFLLPVENKTIRQMVKLFLSCQRCSKVSTKPKQLECSHTICAMCALAKRKRTASAGAWMLECATCGRVNVWQDKNGELSGLEDNTLMQQMLKQMAGQDRILTKETALSAESMNGLDYSTMFGDQNMTINIVSAVKEKIEIQEALQYSEKKMFKCQQQTRYVKGYEKRINASKSAIAQKIKHSTEILIATVIQEQTRLLKKLEDMFEEELKPVVEARENLQKQTQSLELVTRCCDVATRMLREGRAPLDMGSFKEMVQKSMKNSKKFSLPKTVKQRYKANVVFCCDEDGFEDLVKNFGELKIKNETGCVPTDTEQHLQMPQNPASDGQPIYDMPPPIYDMPPDAEVLGQNGHNDDREVLYEEIPADYYNFEYQQSESPDSDTYPTPPRTPPPRPPKNNLKFGIEQSLNEAVTKVFSENRRQLMEERLCQSDGNTTDSFSSDSEEDDATWEEKSPQLPPRTLSLARNHKRNSSNASSMSLTGQRSPNMTNPGRKPPGSPGIQLHGIADPKRDTPSTAQSSPILARAHSMRSITSSCSVSSRGRKKSGKFLFSVGRICKAGSRETRAFQTPPEIASGADGKIWISDTSGHRIQAHEGTCGNLVTSFKTALNGVTLKPRGIAVFENGRKVATTCGRCVVVWSGNGAFIRKCGPSADFGKVSGVAADQNGNLILGDIENLQIALESSPVKITTIGRAAGAVKSTWPGRVATNGLKQIVTADYTEHCVKIFNMDGSLATKFGSFGTDKGQMRYPCAVAVDQQGRIYVADECNNRISVFTSDGKSCLRNVLTKEDGLNFPHAVAVLPNGNIVVSDDSKLVKVYKGMEV